MTPLGKSFLIYMEHPASPGIFRVIAKCRNNSVSYNNTSIDVSKNDGTRWRKLIPGGVQSLAVSAEGVFSDDAMVLWVRQLHLSNSPACFKIVDGTGNVIISLFKITSFGEAGPFNKEHSFNFGLASSGRPYFYSPYYGPSGNLKLANGIGTSPGFPIPSPMVALPPPGPPLPEYPGDVFTQVSPYVGCTTGTADNQGVFYKMLGVFNVLTPGATPVFTGDGYTYAAMVCPDGTAQAFGGPLTQVGLYLVYGFVEVNIFYSGVVGETRTFRIQFNSQDQVFTVTRPGIKFAGSIPTYHVNSASGSTGLTPRGFSSFSDYTLTIDTTPQTYSHFGADNLTWAPSFGGGSIGGSASWTGYVMGDGTTYYAEPYGTVTNDDPYPLPPAGAVFGTGASAPVRTARYLLLGGGMVASGLDYYYYFVQTF